MASTRTICTECKSVVTLPEPAEVGDVVTCPKCEGYFTVPRTKLVPPPGAAKPAQAAKPLAAVPAKPKVTVEAEDEDDLPPPPKKKPVVVVEDDEDEDEEEEERPKKKKKPAGSGGKKKKKRRKDEEKSFKDSPVRYAILGVLVLVMLVGAYFLYKKMMKGDPPDIVIQATEPDLSKPLTKEEIEANRQKAEKAKVNNQGPKTGLRSVDRQKATNDLKQLAIGYMNHRDATGKPPAKPGDLLMYLENNSKLVKDVEDGVYILYMNVNFATLTSGTSNTILGYYHEVPTKGGMVAFADGSVRQVNVAEFEAAPKAGK